MPSTKGVSSRKDKGRNIQMPNMACPQRRFADAARRKRLPLAKLFWVRFADRGT